MKKHTVFLTAVVTTAAAFGLTGCAGGTSNTDADASSSNSESSSVSSQSLEEACDLAATGINDAFTAYGDDMSSGDSVDAAALETMTEDLHTAIADTADSITNPEVKASLSTIADDVAAMVQTSKDQVASKEENGEVSDDLNTQFESQTDAMNDHVDDISELCS